MFLNRLTEEQARTVFDVLADVCKAPRGQEFGFVSEYTCGAPSPEWRLMGALGYDGKFRFPGLTVDCDPERSTPERREMVSAANVKLAELRTQFLAR